MVDKKQAPVGLIWYGAKHKKEVTKCEGSILLFVCIKINSIESSVLNNLNDFILDWNDPDKKYFIQYQ